MLLTAEQYVEFEGGSGQYRQQDIETALALAEQEIETAIGTFLVPTAVVDEQHPMPTSGRLSVNKPYLQSVESISIFHAHPCTCERVELEQGCAAIAESKLGIITVGRCGQRWFYAEYPVSCVCAIRRVTISYTSGLPSALTDLNTRDGKIIAAAICSAAAGFLYTGVGLHAQGNVAVTSYSGAGYSQSVTLAERGAQEILNPKIDMAWRMVKYLKVRRTPTLRRT